MTSEQDQQWSAERRRRFAVEVESLVDAGRDRVPGLEEVASSTGPLDAADDDGRREALRDALGSIEDHGHEWDGDPAAWVREQRSGRGQV